MTGSQNSVLSNVRPAARLSGLTGVFVLVLLTAGCGGDDSAGAPVESTPVGAQASGSAGGESQAGAGAAVAAGTGAGTNGESGGESGDSFDFAPLGLTALSEDEPGRSDSADAGESRNQRVRTVIERLKPLQVLLGDWRGTTRREFEGFKAVDSHEWIWDLQTDPDQPALLMTSDQSPYLRSARLTWDRDTKQFVLHTTDPDGLVRRLTGDFTDPVHEEVGGDDKLHRVFRLQFTQAADSDPGPNGDYWQIAFAQQENNRYLLELDRRRGSADFRRYDTVSTQREGTSFAVSDSGYGEKTCIISEGLGTIEVRYQGRSYWVCCSGCRAAFEEDPEKWIALAARRAEERREAGHADP